MWKEKLNKIAYEESLSGEQINSGASEKELKIFENKLQSECNATLPAEYKRILKTVNGIEFNGFVLYGVDQDLLDSQCNQHINGFIENNKIWHENDWQKRYVFLGESNISWYVYDLSPLKYCELDNPSGRQIAEFEDIDAMVEKVLTDALETV